MYTVDKLKWTHLDKDGDGALSHDEFRRFLRPEEDEELRRIEINSMLKEYDENQDGKISNEEYAKMSGMCLSNKIPRIKICFFKIFINVLSFQEAETGQVDSLGEEIDANKDGFGDYDEFARYYLPSSTSTIDEETNHLLRECDTDHDGSCTPDEVVQAYSSFAGSQITDYGSDLETMKEDL